MKTISINIFQFSELSDQAKKMAREWYREGQQDDNYFSESVYEDAASIAESLVEDTQAELDAKLAEVKEAEGFYL